MNENIRETHPSVPPKGDGTTGKTVGALVLGITGVVLDFTLIFGFFGLICGAVGLLFSIREKKEHPSVMATAAFIISIIALAGGALSSVACVACVGVCALFGADFPANSYFYQDLFNTVEYF